MRPFSAWALRRPFCTIITTLRYRLPAPITEQSSIWCMSIDSYHGQNQFNSCKALCRPFFHTHTHTRRIIPNTQTSLFNATTYITFFYFLHLGTHFTAQFATYRTISPESSELGLRDDGIDHFRSVDTNRLGIFGDCINIQM